MEIKHIFLGIVTAAFVFGAFFVGAFHGQRCPNRWRDFFGSSSRRVSRGGIAWAIAVPTTWVLLYYAFIAHIWFSLGRWPDFGENLQGWFILAHLGVIHYLGGALLVSMFVAPLVLVGTLVLRPFRHIAVYTFCYGATVGLAWCALYLAPHQFLNWLFD
jgi:hypothetical protein